MTENAPEQTSERRISALEEEIARHGHGRVPAELRRRQLLGLAEELFGERGYEATSMDELAARAGVSKPVIYAQFGSKGGLLSATVEALGHELNAAVAEAVAGQGTPEDMLRAGSVAFFRFVAERRAAWALAAGAIRGQHDPAAGPLLEAQLETIRSRQDGLVANLITAAARRLGSEPDPLHVGAITRGLNGLYEGLVEWWKEHPEVPPEQLADWVVELVIPGLVALAANSGSAPG